MEKKQRNSNIELLRIIAMLMIVAHHFSVHGGFSFDSSRISVNLIWVQFLQLGGKVGVDIFVLISGYYLVSRTSFSTYKVLKLWGQMLFYSVVIFVAAVGFDFSVFSKKALLDTFFPVSMGQWWFASTYFVLFLLSPFLNAALTNMSKGQYQQLLLLTIVIWSILPSLSGLYPRFSVIAPQLSNLVWFGTLYSLAAYIRLWHPSLRHTSRYYLTISACTYLITLLSAIVFDYLNMIQQTVEFVPTVLFEMNSITILVISVTVFLGFLQIDLLQSKVVNITASATFGVYLLHDQGFIRPLLWETIFKNATYTNSSLLIPYSLAVIIIVYLMCTFVELVRITTIESPLLSVIHSVSDVIDKSVERLSKSKLAKRL